MPHLETFHETFDGQKLYLQAWEPESERRAAMLLVHGLGEHSSRYTHLAEFLNTKGIAVYTFDGRGHGKSVQPKVTAYFDRAAHYVKDVDDLFKKMKSYVGDTPCFIMGHSMGGGMVAQHALRYQPEATGIILSAPALMAGDDISRLLIWISGLLSKIAPKLKAVKLDSSHLSHDPQVKIDYDADERVYSEGIPARTGAELLSMMKEIQAKMDQFKHPYLLLHGTEDHLTNIAGSKMLHEKASSQDKTLKLYEGFYHELVNEVKKDEVMNDIANWILARS